MLTEDIARIIEEHKYPKLHAGDTGINVVTLQIWLKMVGFYQGPTSGLFDQATVDAVVAFQNDRLAQGVPIAEPKDAVVDWDTWDAMENVLEQRLPPNPTSLQRMPFPRRPVYGSEEEYLRALGEGLRSFGFTFETTPNPFQIPVFTNENGVGIVHDIPPGKYTLDLNTTQPSPGGSLEIQMVDEYNSPLNGRARIIGKDVERSVVVSQGHALVNDLEPGEYEIILEEVDEKEDITSSTGSLEIHLRDEYDLPISGSALLIGESPDPQSIEQSVRLFQALSRSLDFGIVPESKPSFDNILSSGFAETTYNYYENVWNHFGKTWGRFYGAPWMGILFHSLNDVEADGRDEEINWGTYQIIKVLYEWGMVYLRASSNKEDLIERIKKPIVIRYLSKAQGGLAEPRQDFSQTGRGASLHLPRVSPKVIDGIPSGQYYGNVAVDSPDYNSSVLEDQLVAFAMLKNDFRIRCSDCELVSKLGEKDLLHAERYLVANRDIERRFGTTEIEARPPKGIRFIWK